MIFYIDCVSGAQHLISLENEIYKNTDDVSKEQMRILKIFIQCYYTGAVPSKCGRRVIASNVLISNINKEIKKIKTDLFYIYFRKIIELAFKGTYDNCAGDSEYMVPETSLAKKK